VLNNLAIIYILEYNRGEDNIFKGEYKK